MSAFDLSKTYLALDGAGRAKKLAVGPDFWESIAENDDARGALVTMFENREDWPIWEMHPKGDEVLIALSGEVVIVFEDGSGESRHVMKAGDTLVVPANTWHRAEVRTPGRMAFITYGEDTQHRPR